MTYFLTNILEVHCVLFPLLQSLIVPQSEKNLPSQTCTRKFIIQLTLLADAFGLPLSEILWKVNIA